MILLLSTYLLCLTSGVLIVTGWGLNRLLERILMVGSVAAAQMVLVIQGLSFANELTPAGLVAGNAGMTLVCAGLSRVLRRTIPQVSWRELAGNCWREIEPLRRDPVCWIWTAATAALLAVHYGLGLWMIPLGDAYHFEMPLFWRQHQTIGSFPTNDPRVLTTSFVAESLAFPGFLFARTATGFLVLTVLASLLGLWVVYSLAKKLGCSSKASFASAVLCLGFSDYALTFLSLRAASFLAAMWTGASLLFLMNSRPQENSDPLERRVSLGCSVFCFLMACGSRNPMTLMAPAYLAGVGITWRGSLFKRHALAVTTIACLAGLLCSGILWNYVRNERWYGNPSGPALMRATLTRDFTPRSIWTRLCRGTVLILCDVMWIPASARHSYAEFCADAVKRLGGKSELAEDNDYYNFREDAIKPLKGCGWVGIGFLVPGAGLALLRCLRRRVAEGSSAFTRANIELNLLFAAGCFILPHAVLHWQAIGLLRLIPAFTILAAPLCALTLENRWWRAFGFWVVVASSAILLSHDFVMVGRRFEWAREGIFRHLSRLGTEHGYEAQYQWTGQPPQTLRIREDYNDREVSQAFLKGIRQPSVIAYAGDLNAETCWMFGDEFQNTVIPVVDDRKPGMLLEPPVGADYLVCAQYNSDLGLWASNHNFHCCFQVSTNQVCFYAAFVNGNKSK